MKRVARNRKLTRKEAAQYRSIGEKIAKELPSLVTRHHERVAAGNRLQALVTELRTAREELGLSLSDLSERTGMDRSALSKLETGQRPNPTWETLARYAEAVGKKLVVRLVSPA